MWKLDSIVRLETVQLLNWKKNHTSPFLALSAACVLASRLLKENEEFLYNHVIVPAVTSENKNRPHNQKYVTRTRTHGRARTHTHQLVIAGAACFSTTATAATLKKKLVETLK